MMFTGKGEKGEAIAEASPKNPNLWATGDIKPGEGLGRGTRNGQL